jgi:hypothetical protein
MRKHALLISSVFGSNCHCEQLFDLMKNVKSGIRARLTAEHLEDACESQYQKLNLKLKDYSSKSSVKYLTND